MLLLTLSQAVLRSSIAKLLSLGMRKARRVVLTGVAHGGSAVYLHADRVEAQIWHAKYKGGSRFLMISIQIIHVF